MLKVKIKNFQSIGNADFEIDGFTVIVGKNNLGKSALVRAIDAALTNRTGTEFIRYGEKQAEVCIKTDDLDIQWVKGDSAIYKVNGEVFSKLNRAVPQPIIDAGIRKIEVGDQTINPMVAHQFNEVFLLDKPGSVVTEVVSSLYNLNTLSVADDLCAKEMRSKKSLLKTRESDLTDLVFSIEKYKDLDSIKVLMQQARTLSNKSEELKEEIVFLAEAINEKGAAEKNTKKLAKVSDLVIPPIDPAAAVLMSVTWVLDIMKELKGLLISVKALTAVKDLAVPVSADLDTIFEHLTNIQTLQQDLESHKSIYFKVQKQKQILDGLNTQFPELEPTLKEILSISEFASAHGTLSSSIASLKKEHATLEQKISESNQALDAFDLCPLCNQPRKIDGSEVHSHNN